MNDDLVVLVDDDGHPRGTANRLTVHGTDTPLHFAFSCHLVDAAGRILVTRRALEKKTWPGVWTNSFCGHPRPGESRAIASSTLSPGRGCPQNELVHTPGQVFFSRARRVMRMRPSASTR